MQGFWRILTGNVASEKNLDIVFLVNYIFVLLFGPILAYKGQNLQGVVCMNGAPRRPGPRKHGGPHKGGPGFKGQHPHKGNPNQVQVQGGQQQQQQRSGPGPGSGPGRPQGGPRELTLTGIVLPHQWDEKDRLTEVIFYSQEAGEFLIKREGAGSQLLRHTHCRIAVSGLVESREGEKLLNVRHYKLLGSALDSGYEYVPDDGS
jgi:hypothetical protein